MVMVQPDGGGRCVALVVADGRTVRDALADPSTWRVIMLTRGKYLAGGLRLLLPLSHGKFDISTVRLSHGKLISFVLIPTVQYVHHR